MIDLDRPLHVYADGREVAYELRKRLVGKSTMTCLPDTWILDIYSTDGDTESALKIAKEIKVDSDGGKIAYGKPVITHKRVESGKEIFTVVFSDGEDFYSSSVSVSLPKEMTPKAIITYAARSCTAPVSVVGDIPGYGKSVRGLSFYGRTVDLLNELSIRYGVRCWYTHGGLRISKIGDENKYPFLIPQDKILDIEKSSDGVTIVRSELISGLCGVTVELQPENKKYIAVAYSVKADTDGANWIMETTLIDITAVQAGGIQWGGAY